MSTQIIVRSTLMSFEREFRQLNEAWIKKYYGSEKLDKQILNNPQQYILDKGGCVFLALDKNRLVGCCALIVRDIFTCELTKMAFDSLAEESGIGLQLGSALIEKARERGFRNIVLKENANMAASISLYRELGFKEVPVWENEKTTFSYKNRDVFMALSLSPHIQPEFYI